MKKSVLVHEKAIRDIMLRIGLFFEDISVDDDIQQVFSDSLMFITFIIEVEQEFEIEIPNEYLLPERIGSLRQLDSILVELTGNQKSSERWISKFSKFVKNIWGSLLHILGN